MRRIIHTATGALGFALLSSLASSQTVRITFESFPGPDGQLGTFDDVPIVGFDNFADQTDQLTNEFSSLGVEFLPAPPIDNQNEVLDASSMTSNPAYTAPNALVSLGFAPVECRFLHDVFSVSALIGIGTGTDTMCIYDAQGTVLASASGNDNVVTLTSTVPIARMTVVSSSVATPVIDNLEFTEGTVVGTNYCQAAINSTGRTARMVYAGSPVASINDAMLAGADLPPLAFAFFLASPIQGFAANPGGSAGNLCLAGPIGRYVGPGQIQQSTLAGSASLSIDLNATPSPTGFIRIQAGDTFHFQCWFRDSSPSGPTSNFTDGIQVVFQ
ncbi:hypothetical protein Poly30_13120 [Planctomycetes bacterium Poly30]|uniref:Uncharacterized protein n=1 Tax=Saltatorellus ferox TaxID=2528018 RepID=A0A518ENZ9_9BACT|nr:hypothetical protein Poly30_13120 [Planctomycetes bacterium Poly30]